MEPTPSVRAVPTSSPSPTDLLIVDGSTGLAELLSNRLQATTLGRVSVVSGPAEAVAFARDHPADPPRAVLLDLVFPGQQGTGLDVIVAFGRWCPESALIVYTQGGSEERALLEVAWSALQPLSILSRQRPIDHLVEAVTGVLRTGEAQVEPAWRDWLQSLRSPWRTRAGYARLTPHAGHAKMWQVLLEADDPPSYRQIADRCGLSVNTLRNYRSDLVANLELHGLSNPSLRDMFDFAQRARPLLAPVVEERLAPAGSGAI